MFKNIKSDLSAGIVVFLVALPLCLGVALASGAPMKAGIISGIIGGIVVGFLSQSHVSVSGPAAGLAAVVLTAISSLGSFEVFLMAVVIAGLIQIIGGLIKGGFIANYIPSNVIKGLLAAIGIILILKQIPHAVGFDIDAEDDFSFFQSDGENTFSELFKSLSFFSPSAVFISVISFLVLIFWEKTPLARLSFFPSTLFVVLLGIGLQLLFQNFFPAFAISPAHLVKIPAFENPGEFITLPAFSSIGNYQVWIVAFTIAIIASLETLLNLEAVENIDPHKRVASPNKELIAQGFGNMLSGLIGGMPVTSVIVRSSVNINAGAATKLSTIIHGIFLFASILFLGPLLNQIPLASLAVILILTGYKLAKVSLFKEMYAKGLNQFVPFLATIVAIVFTDLLVGVTLGMVISIFHILRSSYNNPFVLQKATLHLDETVRIELPNQVSFLNKATIKDTLWSLPANSQVIIDGSHCDYIDNDVLEVITDFEKTFSVEQQIKLNIIGLREFDQNRDHIDFVQVMDKETQQRIKPEEVLEILKRGNQRFLSGDWSHKYLKQQVNATSMGQNPIAVILSCIDSRTTTEHVFDLGLGDIFSVRIAGNVLNEDILGSIEFATKIVGTKLVVVLGHTKCGAIVGACNHVEMGNLTNLLNKVKPAIEMEKTISGKRDGSNPEFVNKVAQNNVFLTMDRIRKESEIIAGLEKEGTIKIVGAFYEVETGEVKFF